MEARWRHDPLFRAALEHLYDQHLERCRRSRHEYEPPPAAVSSSQRAAVEFEQQAVCEQSSPDPRAFRDIDSEGLARVLGLLPVPRSLQRLAVGRLQRLEDEERLAARAG